MPSISRRFLITLSCLSWCLLLAAPRHASCDDQPGTRPEKKIRLAVIGASASAGFGIVVEVEKPLSKSKGDETDEIELLEPSQTVKRMIRLVDLIDAADLTDQLIQLDLSSHMFFTRPFGFGRSSVDRALSWKPDIVFAVDFLFWYVYGTQPEESRIKTLETGLEQLDRLAETGVPMAIGTIPDLHGVDSFVLTETQIPKTDTVKNVNRRIEEWAQARENVVVVPLFELNKNLNESGAIEIGIHTWHPKRDGIDLIAPDKLHPTYEGLICITQAIEVAFEELDAAKNLFANLELDQTTLMKRMRVRREEVTAP